MARKYSKKFNELVKDYAEIYIYHQDGENDKIKLGDSFLQNGDIIQVLWYDGTTEKMEVSVWETTQITQYDDKRKEETYPEAYGYIAYHGNVISISVLSLHARIIKKCKK